MSCAISRVSALPRCVWLEGATPYPVFGMEFSGFDVPVGYVGVDGKAIGHVVIEARLQRNSPTTPCIGSVKLGTVVVAGVTAAEYRCPGDSLRIQREAMHGEGAYAGHLILESKRRGVDYIVSAHGYTTENLTLLKQLVRSSDLVP